MINLHKSTKNEFYVIVFLIVIVQLVLGLQGFDVCDDGFVLTFYQQIYNDPSSVEYNFVYWLSGVVGGLWYELYPRGGLLWFRIFTVIINTISFIMAYQVFKKYLPKRLAILGLLVVLFINDFGFLTYYHNHLTALLAILSVFYLIKAIENGKVLYYILTGFFIGINVFARLPNVTLFIFVLAIPFHNYISGVSIKQALKIEPILYYSLGIILGFITVFILLISLGQLEIMNKAVFSLFDLGSTEGSSHNFIGLIKTYVNDYKRLFTASSKFIIGFFGLIILFLLSKENKKMNYTIVVISFLFFLYWIKKNDVYIAYTFGYLGTLLIIFSKHQNKILRTLALIGFLMLTFLIIGSGGAIKSSGYMCIWFSVPLFFFYLYTIPEMFFSIKSTQNNYSFTIPNQLFKTLVIVLSVSFFSAKGISLSKDAYFDSGSRLEKTYGINNELAAGVYTTEKRAKIINELLKNLKTHVSKNDYLLTYDKIPMLHFLTETRPYMYNPWVMIYDYKSFEKQLKRAEKEINVYPIVVAQKFETIWEFSEPIPRYLSEDFDNSSGIINSYDSKKNKTLNTFLSENKYQIIWSNNYFNIYKTEKVHQ